MVSRYASIAEIRDSIKAIVSTTDARCKARSRSGSAMADRMAIRKDTTSVLCDEMQAIDIFCATASVHCASTVVFFGD
eukprot:12862448-Prorocentrum_lima.AAC.1